MPLWFPGFAYAQEGVQQQLVQAAADIRTVEYSLQNIEDQQQRLELKRINLEHEYQARRAKMAQTLSALTHMSRTPREAALIRPGGPLQAARTQMILSSSFPVVEGEAQSFKNLLSDLEKTKHELDEKISLAQTARADLSARHAKLSALMESRGAAPDAAQTEEVARLVREAKNLKDLLASLDDKAVPAPAVLSGSADEGQLPVSGIIRVGYGQLDTGGAKSSGLSIETLPGSVVVAPLSGVIRYTGPFRGYGNIVIIGHAGGYYSLIAGLDKINVSTGQTIVSGEPIAILAGPGTPTQSRERKIVYYELRYGGQPVNPSRKLPDIG